jgi:hypothetical protein
MNRAAKIMKTAKMGIIFLIDKFLSRT